MVSREFPICYPNYVNNNINFEAIAAQPEGDNVFNGRRVLRIAVDIAPVTPVIPCRP